MGGGKSSSSSSSENTTTTSTATSTGTVGDVVQGQTITINQDLPDQAVEVFKQLVSLSGQAIEVAASAGQYALDSTNKLAESVKQPDVSVIKGSQTQSYYLIGAMAFIGAIIVWRTFK